MGPGALTVRRGDGSVFATLLDGQGTAWSPSAGCTGIVRMDATGAVSFYVPDSGESLYYESNNCTGTPYRSLSNLGPNYLFLGCLWNGSGSQVQLYAPAQPLTSSNRVYNSFSQYFPALGNVQCTYSLGGGPINTIEMVPTQLPTNLPAGTATVQ
jgi:hypothetical protein